MRYYHLLGLIIFSLLLFGCQQNNKSAGMGVPFIGGDEGLSISFRTNAPPDQVFDSGQMPFDIDVILKNNGEYTIPAGETMVTIQGLDANAFGKSVSDLTRIVNTAIESKKKSTTGNVIDSAPFDVIFQNLNYKGKLMGDFEVPLRANVCYLYQSQAVVGLCISSNPFVDNGVCNVQEAKSVFNSGAPVHVENFVEYVKGKDKIGFSFDIVEKGSGEIIKDTQKDCLKAALPEKGAVFVSVNTQIPGLTCRLMGGSGSSGYVRLSDGKATVDCDQPIKSQGDYTKPISIILRYRYSDTISKNLIIKKSFE